MMIIDDASMRQIPSITRMDLKKVTLNNNHITLLCLIFQCFRNNLTGMIQL